MDPVNVTLSIGELHLEGVEPRFPFEVAAALQAELVRLLSEGGVPSGLLPGRAGTDVALEAAPRAPVDIRRAGAQALYRGWR